MGEPGRGALDDLDGVAQHREVGATSAAKLGRSR